jgi:hypothetical protein
LTQEKIIKRDLFWIIGILIGIIILICSIKLSNNRDIINIFSFVSSGVSIALALAAIGYAVYQSGQAERQNSATIDALGQIKAEIIRVTQMKDDLTKIQNETNKNFRENISNIEGLLHKVEFIASGDINSDDKDKVIDEYKNTLGVLSTELDKLRVDQENNYQRVNTFNNITHTIRPISINQYEFQVEVKILDFEKGERYLINKVTDGLSKYYIKCNNVNIANKITKNNDMFVYTISYISNNGKLPKSAIKDIFVGINEEILKVVAIRKH